MATRKQVEKTLEKLSLKPGDILVVRTIETLERLRSMSQPKGIDFPIPILFSPEGLDKINVATLEEFLKAARQATAPSLII